MHDSLNPMTGLMPMIGMWLNVAFGGADAKTLYITTLGNGAALGVYKAALDVYLRLEHWDQVIDCYRHIGRPDKAEEIVRRKLADNDRQPELHCLLGEITGDIECSRGGEAKNEAFPAVAKIAALNQGLYDMFASPLVRQFTTERAAEMRRCTSIFAAS